MAPLLVFVVVSLLSVSTAEDDHRAHGLNSEPPVAVSPEAFAFFHPITTRPCSDSSDCSTLPLAATVKSAPAHESQSPTTDGGHKLGAGGIAGISVSFLFVAVAAMGVYYVLNKRKANLQKAKPEQHGEA